MCFFFIVGIFARVWTTLIITSSRSIKMVYTKGTQKTKSNKSPLETICKAIGKNANKDGIEIPIVCADGKERLYSFDRKRKHGNCFPFVINGAVPIDVNRKKRILLLPVEDIGTLKFEAGKPVHPGVLVFEEGSGRYFEQYKQPSKLVEFSEAELADQPKLKALIRHAEDTMMNKLNSDWWHDHAKEMKKPECILSEDEGTFKITISAKTIQNFPAPIPIAGVVDVTISITGQSISRETTHRLTALTNTVFSSAGEGYSYLKVSTDQEQQFPEFAVLTVERKQYPVWIGDYGRSLEEILPGSAGLAGKPDDNFWNRLFNPSVVLPDREESNEKALISACQRRLMLKRLHLDFYRMFQACIEKSDEPGKEYWNEKILRLEQDLLDFYEEIRKLSARISA